MNNWQKLKWFILSGITENIGEAPVNRLIHREEKGNSVSEESDIPPSPSSNQTTFSDQAKQLAMKAKTLAELYEARAAFDGCPLKKTAAHTLNGYGATHPLVLCLVETPDTTDDRDGRLMAAETGVLFNKMLSAIGLDLAQNTYVSALIPWRPPGNRKPTTLESAVCKPFWEREIQLLQPKCLILFGASVSEALLGINSLTKARGHWHTYQNIPTRVSLSPGTLMKMPAQKKLAWEDLKQVREQLEKLNTPTAQSE